MLAEVPYVLVKLKELKPPVLASPIQARRIVRSQCNQGNAPLRSWIMPSSRHRETVSMLVSPRLCHARLSSPAVPPVGLRMNLPRRDDDHVRKTAVCAHSGAMQRRLEPTRIG